MTDTDLVTQLFQDVEIAPTDNALATWAVSSTLQWPVTNVEVDVQVGSIVLAGYTPILGVDPQIMTSVDRCADDLRRAFGRFQAFRRTHTDYSTWVRQGEREINRLAAALEKSHPTPDEREFVMSWARRVVYTGDAVRDGIRVVDNPNRLDGNDITAILTWVVIFTIAAYVFLWL